MGKSSEVIQAHDGVRKRSKSSFRSARVIGDYEKIFKWSQDKFQNFNQFYERYQENYEILTYLMND